MNPTRPVKFPLRRKIFLSLAGGLLACTTVLTVMQYRLSSRTLTAEWESKAGEYGQLLEFAFQPLVQNRDRSGLSRAVSQVA